MPKSAKVKGRSPPRGVETEEQLELLRRLGCDMVQGYYFTRPVTSEEATALLENLGSARGSNCRKSRVVSETAEIKGPKPAQSRCGLCGRALQRFG